jgi:uncharacterized protein (DUF342 family)
MAYTTEQLNKAVNDLKRQRDELKQRLHLGEAQVRDEWTKLETKLDELKTTLSKVGKEAGKSAEGVVAALGLAVDEIQKGYKRIKKAL